MITKKSRGKVRTGNKHKHLKDKERVNKPSKHLRSGKSHLVIDSFRSQKTFPIGKYKDLSVQEIVIKDINYCKWYIENVTIYPKFRDALVKSIRLHLHHKVEGLS